VLGELSADERAELEKIKALVNDALQKITRKHQQTITELLGRLEEKYEVGLATPTFDPDYLPLNIALEVSVANIIDVKFADSDQLIRGCGGNHHQLA
jgi:hypothetical protein